MKRRALLSTVGTGLTLGLSGCTSTADPRSASTNSTQTSSPTTSDSLAVTDAGTQSWVVGNDFPDSKAVFGEQGKQFLVFKMGVDGESMVAYDEFEIDAGTTYTPTEYIGIAETSPSLPYGPQYTPSAGGWVAFHIPEPLDADAVTLRWPEGEYRVERALLDELATPPAEFAVREFSFPETYEAEMTATLTVENTGDVDGTFIGAINQIGIDVDITPVAEISLDVPAGASESWTYSTTVTGSPGEEMTLDLRWSGGEREATVTVE
ncbi:hypothetical protein [Halomarina oriensis]|uniref:Uncharacterized protein n=1 Tax=Halomarina oriensis TaxID=671145 RepID=A0A6B0GHH3_9EURY|nr:hypothetical protein [Halomarina oriensis]MWG34174.1 hypothetical protein [Halomarina oriensis]